MTLQQPRTSHIGRWEACGSETCGSVGASKAGGLGMGKHIVGSCMLSSNWICGIGNYCFFLVFFVF